MKQRLWLLTALLLVSGFLFAQDPQISISCSPSEIFVNNLATGSMDPVNPDNQPVLTSITISNLTPSPFMYQVMLSVMWNDIEIIGDGTDISFMSLAQLHPNNPVVLTNRDFIRQSVGNFFDEPDGDISLETIVNASPVLSDAMQSGFFPDGILTFQFRAVPVDIPGAVESMATFRIRIKNITNIFLTYPGRPLGDVPPDVTANPVTYLWNSMSINYNEYKLVINEYPANQPPTFDNVFTTGRKVYDGVVRNNIFSEYLPYQEGFYYAWQISTHLIDENDPAVISGKQDTSSSGTLRSNWFVFRYSSDFGGTDSYYQQLLALLNMMNNPVIQQTFAQGYRITGAVFHEGQAYTGQDAVNLVKPLVGKDIDVELSE